MIDYSVVIPTTGRESLWRLLSALDTAMGPRPREIIVVDDRPGGAELDLLPSARLLRSGGRGPAAARNTGWRHSDAEWIAFLDDDVVPGVDWPARLTADLTGLGDLVGASTAEIVVPLPADRRPTDDERGTAGLADARWITADMAYRRSALAAVGGFDERFPRAYREDADLALRVRLAGYAVVRGARRTTHPVRPSGTLASVRAQRGNADDVLMRIEHGRRWRELIGEGPGRLPLHVLTTGAAVLGGLLAAVGRRRAAAGCAAGWAALTAEFAARRIRPGPRTPAEIGRMVLTSVLIPPAACLHRLRGEVRHRAARRGGPLPPQALLFDRDDTLIGDVPYLADPAGVRPMPGAEEALRMSRAAGLRLGVVSNQSGVARGLISADQLAEVNARVEDLLGPFQTWQVCVHGPDDGCECRKPAPGMVFRAAQDLGVPVERCVVIGDTGADIAAAAAAGARAILVPTARTRPEEVVRARAEAAVADDIVAAVALALAGVR
ncbi:histidinol-phosphate phosphatase family protein [Actinoalloteichus hoggarensis]|uniref:D,D-heptose 1,7-bisphosphate phosphatase n=1 Tax=Actinoalloteichus hoggarensis TaxID=1470176 RepID=A0A221W1D3_9PSEU|nr:HAD-IIIA family hydrolase [Actinoalloteichus hoggarensis]ASO19594.1 D-glycero-beta-D-manno-heptose-1,7-bisphosphate 7-phosphatase [Actinoalloteichus hoggarensis]MBB5919699.1 histidinol-phosphate phosphatase family protein [Actinoalloteichus hoggarensis]